MLPTEGKHRANFEHPLCVQSGKKMASGKQMQSAIHGGTLAMSQNLRKDTQLTTRMALSSQGNNTAVVHISTNDMVKTVRLRCSFELSPL